MTRPTNSRRSFKTLTVSVIIPTIHLRQSIAKVDHSKRRIHRRVARAALRIFVDKPRHHHQRPTNHGHNLPHLLSSLLHLHLDSCSGPTPLFLDMEAHLMTPTVSPKEVISMKWHEFFSSASDWSHLIDPLQPWLRQEIVKYGEFAQATYDAFDSNSLSEYCGSCRYSRRRLFKQLGLTKHGYNVTKYIYAMSQVELPHWLERSHLADPWSQDSNWMGYVAVSDDAESLRIGRRDIVVAWRGTVEPLEWYKNIQRNLKPIGKDGEVKVEHGFHSIYTSKSDSTRYNKSSASEQVMKELTRVVDLYKQMGEEVGLTITGHSLGGALALLNAHEAAAALPGVPICVISFGAPRVGNALFRDKLEEMRVKTLRVVSKQDVVPHVPGLFLNEYMDKFEWITDKFEWITGPLDHFYVHVGSELELDIRLSDKLQHGLNVAGAHSLETYLHLVDGFESSSSAFRANARRDVALVNKHSGMLVDELKIPEKWHQEANKGLVRNSYGRWVLPKRDAEDIPSPSTEDSPV